jgi:cobalt-precorrin-5B (C1)-methyltransferase
VAHADPGEAPEGTPLRHGWTTGACATAATAAATSALLGRGFPDPVEIVLPRDRRPAFALDRHELGDDWASASIVKDAGDDPDVTHGALITSTVRLVGDDVTFRAGEGVGTVTKPGLPLAVGEPAINPVPRRLMTEHVRALTDAGVEITISVEDGAEIARHTWNPRLGIVGGLSILGTTGVVVPYSCAAWIDSIRRGVDVARAAGHRHVAGATGSTSEETVARLHGLPLEALLDMGDFAGAVLKYVRTHPVERLTIAGGIGKLTKLAQGHLDLHSKRSQVDFAALATLVPDALADRVRTANTALDALQVCAEHGVALGEVVAARAREEALRVLDGAPVAVDVVVIDRAGTIVGRAGP